MGRSGKVCIPTHFARHAQKRQVHACADIRSLVWEVEAATIQLSLRAGNRWQLLNLVDIKAKTLFAMIRLGIQIEAIAEKRYEPISLKLVEIGKIVGGLKKTR